MSFNPITWFETEAPIVEADVQAIIADIKNDVTVVVTKLEAGLSWLATQTPAIVAGEQALATFAEAVAPAAGPEGVALVNAALATATTLTAGLKSFAASYNAATTGGGITATAAAEALVTGYQTITAAQAAQKTAASTIAGVSASAAAS